MTKKILKQIKKIVLHVVNLIQGYILGDDIISIKLRFLLLKIIGNNIGQNCKILGGSEFLGRNLTTGKNVFINRKCYFDMTGSIILGDNVFIGHGVTFITAHHDIGTKEKRAGDTVLPKNITIEDGVWIGANATILPDIIVKKGSVIGANALVTKNIPENCKAIGIPAQIIPIEKDNS